MRRDVDDEVLPAIEWDATLIGQRARVLIASGGKRLLSLHTAAVGKVTRWCSRMARRFSKSCPTIVSLCRPNSCLTPPTAWAWQQLTSRAQ